MSITLDPMPPTPHQPAIKHGQPRAFSRLERSLSVACLFLVASSISNSLLDWDQGVPARVILVVTRIVGLGAFFWLLDLSCRSFSILRALGRVPPACFNCLYPMPGLPVCPECGCRQDYEDLSNRWKKWFAKRRKR